MFFFSLEFKLWGFTDLLLKDVFRLIRLIDSRVDLKVFALCH